MNNVTKEMYDLACHENINIKKERFELEFSLRTTSNLELKNQLKEKINNLKIKYQKNLTLIKNYEIYNIEKEDENEKYKRR